MSELKAFVARKIDDGSCDPVPCIEVYLKSEADKVIAEKDAEIAQLQAMLEERNKQVGELKEEIHNLKRSLIVARHEVAKARGKKFSNKYRENRAKLNEAK
jgi:molecular chaperone GrpE (heat shock protein)